MPQPLTKPLSFLELTRGPHALMKRPGLAVSIAVIATHWGAIERSMELLLVTMLRNDAPLGHAIYTALSGSAAQRSVYDKIASLRLTAEEQETLQKIWRDFSGRGKERNRIVHGIWAIHDSLPDALILLDMDGHTEAIAAWEAGPKSNEASSKALSAGNHLTYKIQDFADVADRMSALSEELFHFGLRLKLRFEVEGQRLKDQPSDGGGLDIS